MLANPCPSVTQPVCGADYRTYSNECELVNGGTTLLHHGECLDGEGLYCDVINGPPFCGPSGQFYCRDTCPACAGGSIAVPRCTQGGACLYDNDCVAQMPSSCSGLDGGSGSDGGTVVGACVNNVCQFSCQ